MNKNINTIKNIIIVILLGAVGLLLSQQTQSPSFLKNETHNVAKIIDGDTIKIEQNKKVRLIGINSPEKGECYYNESKEFLENLLRDKQIILEKDISGVDDYGRLLRYVIMPNKSEEESNMLVNYEIIRQGFAKSAPSAPDNRYKDLFVSAQEQAIRENKGMWSACNYKDKLKGRRETNNEPPSPEYIIKGNISTRGYGKTYLLPGCDNYATVKIDVSKGEQYFRTEEEAIKAGFRKATNCP